MLDIHTHVFCWGENPREGFLSESTRRAWLTRLVIRLTGLNREHGDTRSEQIRNRLTRQVDQSQFDRVVVLAQDAVYRPEGTPDLDRTHFYVSNDYVLDLADRHEKVLAGCSINPLRRDALEELEARAWKEQGAAAGDVVAQHAHFAGQQRALGACDDHDRGVVGNGRGLGISEANMGFASQQALGRWYHPHPLRSDRVES